MEGGALSIKLTYQTRVARGEPTVVAAKPTPPLKACAIRSSFANRTASNSAAPRARVQSFVAQRRDTGARILIYFILRSGEQFISDGALE